MMDKKAFLNDVSKVTILNVVSKTVGLLVPFFIAIWFGVTSHTDAFFFAYGCILFISTIFAATFESVIVPFITEVRFREGSVDEFLGKIIGNVCIIILVLLSVCLISFKPILSVVTRFNSTEASIIYLIFIEGIPLVFLLVWTSILSGTLNAYKKFTFPAIAPLFRAIINVFIIFITKDSLGVHSIVLGYIAGELIRLFFLLAVIWKLGLFKLKFLIRFDSSFKNFFRICFFSMASLIGVQANLLVDKTMASWLTEGSVSILYYAERLYMIPIAFMTSGIFVVVLSNLSNSFYGDSLANSINKLSKEIIKIKKIITYLSIVIFLTFLIMRSIIVNSIFNHGQFPQNQIPLVMMTWSFYLFGFVPHALSQLYVRGLLVLKKTDILMKCSFYGIILNISLNYILMKKFGVAGIALATTLVSLFSLYYYRKSFIGLVYINDNKNEMIT